MNLLQQRQAIRAHREIVGHHHHLLKKLVDRHSQLGERREVNLIISACELPRGGRGEL